MTLALLTICPGLPALLWILTSSAPLGWMQVLAVTALGLVSAAEVGSMRRSLRRLVRRRTLLSAASGLESFRGSAIQCLVPEDEIRLMMRLARSRNVQIKG